MRIVLRRALRRLGLRNVLRCARRRALRNVLRCARRRALRNVLRRALRRRRRGLRIDFFFFFFFLKNSFKLGCSSANFGASFQVDS